MIRRIDRSEKESRVELSAPTVFTLEPFIHEPDRHDLMVGVGYGGQSLQALHCLQDGCKLLADGLIMCKLKASAPDTNFIWDLRRYKILKSSPGPNQVIQQLRQTGIMIPMQVGQEQALDLS